MEYLLESREKLRRPITRAETEAMCHSRCTLKPTTFKYFVTTENIKIIGSDKIAEPGDFIVVFPDRAMGYTAAEFRKQYDICYHSEDICMVAVMDNIEEIPNEVC